MFIFDVNFTNITTDFVSYSTQGYITAMSWFFWPMIFTGIIVYTYLKQQNIVAAMAVALILFAAFGNYLINVGPWTTIIQILVSLIFTGLVIAFIIKRRGS